MFPVGRTWRPWLRERERERERDASGGGDARHSTTAGSVAAGDDDDVRVTVGRRGSIYVTRLHVM